MLLNCLLAVLNLAAPPPGTHAVYRVMSAEVRKPAPFARVDVIYGPADEGVSWQLAVYEEPDSPAPAVEVRATTDRDPFTRGEDTLRFETYAVRFPESGETLGYRNVHTGRALLPTWGGFIDSFVPRAVRGARLRDHMPVTAAYLGHILTLTHVGRVGWPEWKDVRVLDLDPELLVGTARNFRDRDGKRLPQHPERQNYPYVRFTPDEYPVMIEAGINVFIVDDIQERSVRDQPVFYYRDPTLPKAPLDYPGDLYRSNYLGNTMFMDEPACIMLGDENVQRLFRHVTDGTALITARVESRFNSEANYGAYAIERAFRSLGVSFGNMTLVAPDYPAWETIIETSQYQMAGGVAGVVHEGRYRLDEFTRYANATTGLPRDYTAEEMLRYTFAFLRGAARHHGKDWGTSIYGQADPAISPLAVKLAYDMGARYLWFWTSDHDHHLPWPEQLELARVIRDHARAKPRGSIRRPKPVLDRAIVLPYGELLTVESPEHRAGYDLWWVREMDEARTNEAARRYAAMARRAFVEIHKAMDAGEEFDILYDDGAPIEGYRHITRIE
jgi:hypothetical protein